MPAPIRRPYRGPVRTILSRRYGYRIVIVAAVTRPDSPNELALSFDVAAGALIDRFPSP